MLGFFFKKAVQSKIASCWGILVGVYFLRKHPHLRLKIQKFLIQNHRKINLGLGLSPKIIISAAKYQFILNM